MMGQQSERLQRALEALHAVCAAPTARQEECLARYVVPTSRPDGMLRHNPAAWREPFEFWLDTYCVCDPRVRGGVECLYAAYSKWEEKGGVPCARDTFERLLIEMGFILRQVNDDMLVLGLTFRTDLMAAGLDPISSL